MSTQHENAPVDMRVLAETDSFSAWQIREPDGEITYHVEFGAVTLHFFQEEWDEALTLFGALSQ